MHINGCQDVKTLLSSLPFVVFYWVRRNANLVAHALAKFASRNSCFSIVILNPSLPW
jgi:hypothetical protein